MRTLSVVFNRPEHAAGLSKELVGIFAVRALALDDIARQEADGLVLVDVDLNSAIHADSLRAWLDRRPARAPAIFAVDRCSRLQTVQAYSIGATDIVYRPISMPVLVDKLVNRRPRAVHTTNAYGIESSCGIIAGITALQQLFIAAGRGVPLDMKVIEQAGETLVSHIEAFGFGDWVQAIRAHHDQTYRHCLLVSGAVAAFACHLGFTGVDRRRVAMAGLLHDAGKVAIPVEILKAPRRLDDNEMKIVKQHPVLGHHALRSTPGLHPEMLDVVLHHHEYLDGTGYPEGLGGGDISDLTRVVTIADIFCALIEARTYRPPMSGRAAFEILRHMGGKLDHHLLNAFKPLSCVEFVPGD